jgi:hypothetical protein
MNLNMLQATIQGLEVQRSTITALKAMSEQAASGKPGGGEVPPNPFAQMWPWNMAPAKSDEGQTGPEASKRKR